MRVQNLLEELQLIQSKLVALIELEAQHHQVVQDGRVKYASAWQEAKAQVKKASEIRHQSPAENEKFLELVRQSSAVVGAIGAEWISKGQELARRRRDTLQEVIKEIDQILGMIKLEEKH